MLRCKCPNCTAVLEISVNVGGHLAEEFIDYNDYYFPQSWREYGGWAMADVEAEDPEYLDELLAQTTPRISGTLRKALMHFVDKRKG